MPLKPIINFLKLESASGILLGIASILALISINSPARFLYQTFLTRTPVSFMVNDGLMVIFFFLVGLEIKREMILGELNHYRKILLPGIAALFGMIFPALIYISLNYHHADYIRGWAIPTATDIAFTLAVLTVLGSRIPLSIKIFLTALAIFDDIGAIVIIALFYGSHINVNFLLLSLALFLTLIYLNLKKRNAIYIYIILGILLWFSIFHSGIHPTISGVLLALTIPTEKIYALEQKLHPWVAYFILPLFAFINMGIPLDKIVFHALFTPVPLGIILGLVLGKSLGIFSAVYISVKSKIAELPTNSNFKIILGASFLCGIGFTMSLFIGDLAFDGEMLELVRAGVVTGSIFSGIVGFMLLS